MSPQIFAELRTTLSTLYPDTPDIHRVIADSGIYSTRITLGSSSTNNWHFVLTEAEKLGRVEALLEVVKGEYGGNPKFLSIYAAYRLLLNQNNAQEADVAKLETLFSKATRLHIDGRLAEALEIFQQIKAIDPYFPGVTTGIFAILQELAKGQREGYINNFGEVIKDKLIQGPRDYSSDNKSVIRLDELDRSLNKPNYWGSKKIAVLVLTLILLIFPLMILWGRQLGLSGVVDRLILNLTPIAQVEELTELNNARVYFIITLDNGDSKKIPVGDTLNVMPGEAFIFEMNVTIDDSPFPRKLTYHYFAIKGTIPVEHTGPTASYVAPTQPGPDIISVLIIDSNGTFQILRSINVVVQEQ